MHDSSDAYQSVPLVLNADLIEHMETTPDTVISMTNGQKFVVLESSDDVIRKVIEFRREIIQKWRAGFPDSMAEPMQIRSKAEELFEHAGHRVARRARPGVRGNPRRTADRGRKAKDVAQFTAALIVLGGTAGAVMVSTPLRTLIGGLKRLKGVFFDSRVEIDGMIEEVIGFATKARKNGLVSLEQEAFAIEDPFLKKSFDAGRGRDGLAGDPQDAGARNRP